MKISKENVPLSKQSENPQQQTQRSKEQLDEAKTKFSSALKGAKAKHDKRQKENIPLSKQAEISHHRQQNQYSKEQMNEAEAKFSSVLKEPNAKPDKQQRENVSLSKQVENPHHRQQTQHPKEQFDEVKTKFSSALKEPKTEEMQSKARLNKRQDDNLFDMPVDSTEAGRGSGGIANSDNTSAETLAVKGSQEPPVARDISSVAQQIATRVLVSPPGVNNPEVRIQLKESVLQGSDVRIFREGGALKVVFVAPNQEAANFIANNREAMTVTLNNRLPGEQIDISIETQQSERDRGEHGEGRSRQQYVADDDDDISGVGL